MAPWPRTLPDPSETRLVRSLNVLLAGGHPRRILDWALGAFPSERILLTTAFGPGGIVLLHLLRELRAQVPVVFIDTLHHFPETLQLAREVADRYALDLTVVRPAPDLEHFEARHGPRLWERDVERFHQVTKVEPLLPLLDGVEAWITGRRRDQGLSRERLPVLEGGVRFKVNPLAHWSAEDLWRFIEAHGLPSNPLHARGYASVGDAPLTTPIHPGEPERAGRWRGSRRTECGLHAL